MAAIVADQSLSPKRASAISFVGLQRELEPGIGGIRAVYCRPRTWNRFELHLFEDEAGKRGPLEGWQWG